MEADHQSKNMAPKPKGYVPMNYAPKKKVESEEKLGSLEQTQLQHAYTFWVKIQDQSYQKKKQFDKFEDELKEIDTVNTVSSHMNRCHTLSLG